MSRDETSYVTLVPTKASRRLPDYVVAAGCVNTFKTRLDKYWKDQDVMYDWTSEITGTGDRSEYILEST